MIKLGAQKNNCQIFDLHSDITHSTPEFFQALGADAGSDFGQCLSNESNQANSHPDLSVWSCLLPAPAMPFPNSQWSGQYH